MTTAWVWVNASAVRAVHDRQLADHGGGDGVRDAGLLASALGCPENVAAYGDADGAALAAAYALGIAKNHPFVDGNKRTAWVVARLFLMLNGVRLMFAPAEAIAAMGGLAAGRMDEAALAAWFRARIGPG